MTENTARDIRLDREQRERAEDLLAEIEQDPDAFAFEVIWLRDRLESLERAAAERKETADLYACEGCHRFGPMLVGPHRRLGRKGFCPGPVRPAKWIGEGETK